MQFKPHHSQSLLQGRLDWVASRPVMVARDGTLYEVANVDFAIPDDEGQARTIQLAGFKIHTPISVYLGPGSTG